MKLEQVMAKFPVGKKVKYYPLKGIDSFRSSEIRSEPWEVCGEVLIKITGVSGGVSIEHLEICNEQ